MPSKKAGAMYLAVIAILGIFLLSNAARWGWIGISFPWFPHPTTTTTATTSVTTLPTTSVPTTVATTVQTTTTLVTYTDCTGTLGIVNSFSSMPSTGTNTFTVTVTNTAPHPVTLEVHDELYKDTNCNGIRDDIQPDSLMDTATAFVNLGYWVESFTGGSQRTFVWSQGGLAAGCYVHTVLACGRECLTGTQQCWQGASSGNIGTLQNSNGFQVT